MGKLFFWTTPDTINVTAAQALQSQLARIGCKLVIKVMSWNVLAPAAATKGAAFDIYLAAWFADYPDPYDVLYHNLDGNTITPKNNFDLSYIDDPKLNRAIEQSNLLPLGPRRTKVFADLDFQAMRDLAPVAPLANLNAVGFVAPNVGGYTYSTFGAIGADLGTLYLK